MAQATLTTIGGGNEKPSRAERIRKLNAQAEELSKEAVGDLLVLLSDITENLEEIASLTSVKAGIRDRTRRLAETIREERNTLLALDGRRGI